LFFALEFVASTQFEFLSSPFKNYNPMARTRWIIPNKGSTEKPIFYHCISRVVDRRFAFEGDEKEKFRMFMRMYENFTGCRVVSYCLMSNHFHLLLEVPPLPEGGFSDSELLERLSALYSPAVVAVVAKDLEEARKLGYQSQVEGIHDRYTRRMHDLSRFMEGLLQRFTRWFNRAHSRSGNLWEDAFKSVIVEDGMAARTICAYIDLNPVRAGMVADSAEYRWSSYGEAMGGGSRGNGKKARAGLVRALMAHKGCGADSRLWAGKVSKDYRMLLLETGEEKLAEVRNAAGEREVKVVRKGIKKSVASAELAQLERSRDVALGKMLRCRIRYFTDGAVIGSRSFVNEAFESSRVRFGRKRKDGARKMRGAGAPAAGFLWSMRDLQKGNA
jgi:REP element-mobilizing transposase RayT